MRTAFVNALMEIAREDSRVWLLTGDLGYSVLERFRDEFPDRFVNAGVAEQNMTSMAAGLAVSGKIVFVYSIANFPTLRCLEQIRNDACYHKLPVRIVSVGGGFAYGPHGYSHHGLEDLAVMRALPGMTVVAPGDPLEAQLITRQLLTLPGPCYLRLGKAGEPMIHTAVPDLSIGTALPMRPGTDATLVATGSMLGRALAAAQTLETRGISTRVLSMHTVKPLDRHAVEIAARETRALITAEEHSEIGGLGSAVAEVLAEMATPRARLYRFAAPDRVLQPFGSQDWYLSQLGDLAALVQKAVAEAS